MAHKTHLNFIANARLKDVIGRDLINDDNIAIIELIKNAKDAGSKKVDLRFGKVPRVDSPSSIIIADSGKGMTKEDIRFKWLNIAYSEKKGKAPSKRESYAGNKGIGRFACDRLGEILVLYTRVRNGDLLRLEIDWTKFEIDDQKSEIGRIETTLEVIDSKRLKDETEISSFAHGTLLHVKQLRDAWTKEKLFRLRRQLEKFVIDPQKNFGVSLVADDHRDIVELNGAVENKIFDKLEFRTTSIHSEIDATGGLIITKLVHDGNTLFTLTEKNPYSALKRIKTSIFFLNQPAKVFFKSQTGYRSVNFGSIFLFLNGFRVLPYGAEAEDWLGLDRRKGQGQRRFFGTRDVVGYIDVRDEEAIFKAVSSREGLVNNRAFQELTSQSQDIPSVLGDNKEYGFFHKICRKLEKFVVEGLDWDSIKTNVTDEDLLLDPKNYEYSTDKQKVIECLDSIISIRTSSEHVEDLDVNFLNVIKVAKDEVATYEELVENLQDKFAGTSVGQLTAAEKRSLTKFVERQTKEIAAKDETAKRLDQKLNVETKRRLFAELEASTDVERILKMHHQTRLLAGQAFKTLDDTIRRFRSSPEKWSTEQLVDVMEKLLFKVDKIRKVSAFASKASFDLATNRTNADTDLVQFLDEYVTKIQEVSHGRLRVAFHTPKDCSLPKSFRPLELMMLVDNVIDNAGKAGANLLEISVTNLKDGIQIRFKDNGKGLSSDIRTNDLFEKGISTTDGSGIGLFHVRQIVNELDGKVSIRNNQGVGATLTVEFYRK